VLIGRRADLQASFGPLVLSHRYSYASLLLAKIGPALDHGAEAEREQVRMGEGRKEKKRAQTKAHCSVVWFLEAREEISLGTLLRGLILYDISNGCCLYGVQ